MIFILFRQIEPDSLGVIKPYFEKLRSMPCDFSVGCTFIWRRLYSAGYAIYDGNLIFEFSGDDEEYGYTYPLGNNPDAAAKALVAENKNVRFCLLTQDELLRLNKLFSGGRSYTDRDWCDYIYLAEDIVSLSGKRFSGQRNHINKFEKLYPDAYFKPISRNNLDEAVSYLNRFYSENPPSNRTLAAERDGVFELFADYDSYGQLGGLLYAGGRAVGLSLGEVVGDTLIVHTEKADRSVEGAYPVLVNAYAREFAGDGVLYINREEDCGELGLRISKLSYHPIRLLEKWNFVV